MKPNNLVLMFYGSLVSSLWFLAYMFTDSFWEIVQLDGLVHLICGAVVALAILHISGLKHLEVVAILILVLFFWEIFERGIFIGHWSVSDYYLMDTIADIMLGAIGGFIIIFDGGKP